MLTKSLSSFLGKLTRDCRRDARRRRTSQLQLRTIQILEPRALLTDAAPYVVSINRTAEADLSFGGSVMFQATFSEAVTGVDAGDFSVIRTGSTSYAAMQVTNTDNQHYLVTVTGVKGSGSLGLSLIDNGSIRDGSAQGLITPGSSPTFLNQQTFSVGTSPESIATGDVNGDGKLDVVVSNSGVTPNGTISVLLGNGNGTFQTQVTYTAGREPKSVTLSDLNGDGKLDVVLANLKDKTIGVMLNNGNGTFQNQQTYLTGRDPNAIALGDVNGDAKIDVVIVNTKDDSITLLTGKGDGTFQSETTIAAGGSPVAVDVVDLNGDSKLDVVVLNSLDNGISVLLGNGNSTFQSRQDYATGTQPVSLTHGDVNNDGKLDLAIANFSSNTVSVLKGNGNGTFQSQQTFATGTSPQAVVLSDLNGDGLLDLTVTNRGSNSLSMLVGMGDGTFQVQQTLATGTAPFAVTVGDVSGDGKTDLLATNRTSNTISVLLSSLAGSFDGQIYQIAEPVLHWQGDIDSKWSTPGNWLENAIPVNGTDLYFDTGTTGFADNFAPFNDLTALAAGEIRVADNATAGDFELSGNAISITKGISVQGNANFRMSLSGVTLLASQQFELAAANQTTWNTPIDLQSYSLTLRSTSAVFAGVVSGAGTVDFTSGAFQLTAANTFTGLTTVKSTVVVDGSIGSETIVQAGGQLFGAGKVNAKVTVKKGGRIKATSGSGGTASRLTTGELKSEAESTLEFLIAGATPGNGGTHHSQFNVMGTVSLAGFFNFSGSSGFTPTEGNELVLINNDGTDAVSGTFANLPEGSVLYNFLGTGHNAKISYKGGDGNDVSLKMGPQILHWRGYVDSKWSTPGNWLEGVAPVKGAELRFETQTAGFAGNFSPQNDIPNLQVSSLFVSDTWGSEDFVISGLPIEISKGIQVTGDNAFTMQIEAVTLTAPQSFLLNSATTSWKSPLALQSALLIQGQIIEFSGAISGTGSMQVQAGKLVLSATNTYTGSTKVFSQLVVNGSLTSPVEVLAGGMILGNGTAAGGIAVSKGGVVSPGVPIGTLSAGNITFEDKSSLSVEIRGIQPGNAVSGYDSLNVTGSVKVAGAMLVTLPSGFVPAGGSSFNLIVNDGSDAIVGTFDGLPNGGNVSVGSITFQISYAGGDGNDLVLTTLYVTYAVSNTLSSGVGSFADAIAQANNHPGKDQIVFQASGVISGPLPPITDTVKIMGFSAPGFGGTPVVQLKANSAGSMSGLDFAAGSDYSVVQGLSITGFAESGIRINANGVRVSGNWIGVNPAGAGDGNYGHGIWIQTGSGVIGGNTVAQRNVISANLQAGIMVASDSTAGHSIQGNYIGTNVAGTSAIGNGWDGISVVAGASQVLIGGGFSDEGNLISGNLGCGIVFDSAGTGNRVSGNRIGTDASGSVAIGNGFGHDATAGIVLQNMHNNAVIVGTNSDGTVDASEGNLVSGNFYDGIQILEFDNAGSHIIAGNLIGVDAGGTGILPNRRHGVRISSASNNRIGTDGNGTADAAEANVIAGNRNPDAADASQYASGILIEDLTGQIPRDNLIAGNFLGTDRNGLASLGNQGNGITIVSAEGTVIGLSAGVSLNGSTASAGNVIRFNRGAGVRISGPVHGGSTAEQFTTLHANSFQANSGLAVDVADAGPTLNSDTDTALDFPILESASIDNGTLVLTGFVSPSATIEFYLNSPRAGQVWGEGIQLIAKLQEGSRGDLDSSTGTYGPLVRGVSVSSAPITQNRFRFEIPLPAGVDDGAQLTAMAVGSVSEFSPLLLVGEQGSAVAPAVTLDVVPGQLPWTQLEGEQLQVSGSFYDPDSRSWTATVDYGDGDGPQQLALSTSKTFDLRHIYRTPGTYSVTVQVTDNGLASGSATLTVRVQNQIPQANFDDFDFQHTTNEGDGVILAGSFTDGGGAHTVLVNWGDSVTTTLQLASGVSVFSTTHIYRDDTNAAGTVTASDIYSVRITIRDAGESTGLTSPDGLFLVDVSNVAPTLDEVRFNGQLLGNSDVLSLTEGDTLNLSGIFTDPGVGDQHTVRISWGDGSTSVVVLPLGDRIFSNLPALSHTWLNDDEDGQYEVRVELWDDDQPLTAATWARTIRVANQAPNSLQISAVPTSINEGGTLQISGTFIDAGVLDGHQVQVIWGDGTPNSVLNLAAGVTAFGGAALSHQYLDNSGGAASYTVQVVITDLDNAAAEGTGSTTVTVLNVAPTVSGLSVRRTDGTGEPLKEGDSIIVSGSFADVSPLDRHQVTISWGDNTQTTATVDATLRTFSATHTYYDNYNPASIVATVADGRYSGSIFIADGGTVISNAVLKSIANVAPEATIAPVAGSTPTVTKLTADVVDPGLDDTFTYLWEISSGFGYTTQGTQKILTFDSTAYMAPLIRLTVRDDDGESETFEVVAIFGTTASETITVTTSGYMRQENGSGGPSGGSEFAAPISGGLIWPNQILVLGFDGSDLLDASALPATHLAILDGGQQQDYLIGGAGADICYPNDGNDTVDGGAGDDRFVLTPNSVLTVIDTSGYNTLDFSRSAFSDNTGITFDLTKIRSSGLPDANADAQIVSTVGATHVVAAFGTFQQLIGSNYGDSLTASSGATVYGGDGKDTLYVGSNTTSTTLTGGADDDVLVISGTNISNLNFGGDDGLDLLRNLGTVTDLTFGGGADDDILENTGAILGTLVFGGDDGVDILTNTGHIAALNFNGGADDDIFVNNGSTITTLSFRGDSDILLNAPGTIGNLNFTGDDGADIFANLGTITTLTFSGGADDDIFVNVGTQTSLNFGGDDDVLLSNTGTVGTIGTLAFNGDDGADLLRNLGTITSLTFGGGADDDVLLNLNTGIMNSLVFGGDDGRDLLRNEGVMTGLIFTGGADDDILQNMSGATITGLNFGGDDGSDLLTNTGTIIGLTFTGGADDDVLNNYGAISSTLVFGGDDGADLFRNAGTIVTLTFGGGADDDIFANLSGGQVGTLTFGGDDGIDLFQNSGNVTTLSFGGGADDDILVNNVDATVGTLVFGGDREFSISGQFSPILNAADDGADTLINFGFVGQLTFTGGADDDVLINRLGGTVISLNFGGDDGIDTLQNAGALTTLTFGGGADDDTLVNTGTITATLTFGGDQEFDVGGNLRSISVSSDDGVDTLANYSTIGAIVFHGGADDDVLLNQTGAAIPGVLFFQGDSGNDVFRNNGTVTTLTFGGGADDDLLINSGTVIATLNFSGDSGNDIFYNTGSEVGSLIFSGGADDDILLNTGSMLALLNFSGGADDDIFQNSGSTITALVFGGDSGNDVLRNTGNDIATLTFGGGADDDVLLSSGTGVGVLSFGGDIDPVTSAMIAGTNAGNDLLIVNGSGADTAASVILFNGDDGADSFRYSATAFTSIMFNGGADDDVFQLTTDNAAQITFNGGADDDILQNNGSGVTNLIFNGDDGSDVLYNNGNEVSELTFSGGSDDDTLVNTGSLLSGLIFSGDSGNDIFVNAGNSLSGLTFNGGADDDVFSNSGSSLTLLTFNGDAGNDRFINQAAGIQARDITFNGDTGSDVLVNYAGGVSSLTFSGGADDDAFQNSGVNVSVLMFTGGADDDVFVNQAAGAITGLNFSGDDGADTLLNSGAMTTLSFGSGADDDVLVNRGIVTTLVFGGDQEFSGGSLQAIPDASDDGADTLLNYGTVMTLQFSGGADDDVLVSNGTVGTLIFTGGADDDVLQNNGAVGLLQFTGGADNDVLINNADGVTTIEFSGDDGTDSFVNKGSGISSLTFFGGADDDTLRIHGTNIGLVVFNGGADSGSDSFHYNAVGGTGSSVTFIAGSGNDYFAWRGSADSVLYQGGAGNDQAIILGSGSLTLDGGEGDDTIYFQSNPQAEVVVVETYGGMSDSSRDTLDFSAFNGNPLNLDLRQTTRQSQSSLFAIALSESMGLENVIGTPFADVIYGNSRDNIITGAQYSAGFSGPVAGSRATTQWVLLDFDTATETGEHEYTPEERQAIAARVQQVYRGPNSDSPWFDVRVALNHSDIPAANVYFATISFNQTPAFGRPGGLASEVDPGNLNLGGTAVVQVNGLLGGVITAEDISEQGGDAGSDKGYAPTIGDEEIGASKPAATSENFILLSAKIAAHELGHLIGLRHQDSFGPIGFGLHDPPGSAAYKPNYLGPVAGVETFDHLMGSGASVGSDRFNDLNDLFFGEREAIKLGFAFSNTQDTITDETTSPHSTAATAQSLILTTVEVPNTLSQGLNASRTLFVQMQSVEGQLEIDNSTQETENDWYTFSGTAGTVVNVEVYSNSLIRYGTGVDNYVDPIVRVWYYDSEVLTLVPFYGGDAVNDDIFEPTDSAIVDLVLPLTGTYYIEVDTFQRDPSDPVFDATNPTSPLNPDNPNNILDYPTLLKRFLDTRDNTDIGAYQLFVSGFARASATDGIDTIRGYGGTDTIDGGSGDSFALSLDPGAAGTANEGSEFSRTLTVTDRAATSWSGSTVNYGDGSGENSLAVSSAGSFTLAHTYADDGSYTITMVIRDDIGQTLTKTLQINVQNVAPTILTFSGSSSVDERSTQTYAFTASDPGTDTFLVHSLSGGTKGTVSNVQLNSVTGAGTFDVTFSEGTGSTILTILLKDSDGAISGSRTLTVTVTNVNDAPTSLVLSASSIAENLAVPTSIGTLSSTDADPGDTFTYSLVNGTGSADNLSFVISGSTLKSNAVFDYETKSSYSLRIRTTDAGGLWFEKAFTITVTDVAEDVTPPVSQINALPAAISTSTITLTATGSDPGAVASGILDYDFYYSTGGSYIKLGTAPANTPSIVFSPAANTTYWFRTLARDNAGNRETKATSDTVTRVGDIVPPASQVTSATANSAGKFTIQMTGTKASGTALSAFDIYVILDGATATLLGTTSAVSAGSGQYTGSITYQGNLDGLSHTYRFYSRGRDLSGNVETAPATSDVVVTATFAAASLTATGIDVQMGANQRSYVRYVDILFSDNPTALLSNGRVAVERFDISATSINAGTGVAVMGFSASRTANNLKLNFGTDGLGGKLQNGDGFYRVRLDLNGNGVFTDSGDASFEFFRLFGDANGDGTVDVADTNLVTGQIGRSGTNLDGDIDGNGTVNATDRLYTTRQRGRKLLSWLLAFLDD